MNWPLAITAWLTIPAAYVALVHIRSRAKQQAEAGITAQDADEQARTIEWGQHFLDHDAAAFRNIAHGFGSDGLVEHAEPTANKGARNLV